MNESRAHASRPDDADRRGPDRSDRSDPDDTGGIDDTGDTDPDDSAMERADRANGEPDAQEPGA